MLRVGLVDKGCMFQCKSRNEHQKNTCFKEFKLCVQNL